MAKKSKEKERLVIQLDPEHRAILDKMKEKSGASFAEIIRRMISKEGGK
jgi:hypothetical protein